MAQPLKQPTDVCLTVDVEFSIAGAFSDPETHRPIAEPVVECRVGGKGHGLDFLLWTLEAHEQRATFFVEPLCSHYFGDEPMRGYAHRIVEAGHEVGLHVHPCWLAFADEDWQSRLDPAQPPSDDLRGRPRAEITRIIVEALRIMDHWGLPQPTSLRMGNLMSDGTLYEVLDWLGLRTTSNVGLAIQPCEDERLRLTSGAHDIGGVTELPVMTYKTSLPFGLAPHRCLTITGSGTQTTRRLLCTAHKAGAGPVVVLTHPFEFAKARDFTYADLRPNRTNKKRLEALCSFVAAHPADFRMAGVSEAAERARAGHMRNHPLPTLSASALTVVRDMVMNRINDMVWYS